MFTRQKNAATSSVTKSDFEVLSLLGKGAFGKVWKVRKKDTRKIYAMKVMPKRDVVENDFVGHTNDEREILGDLSFHPFVVALHHAFQTKHNLYLVMDYVPGGSMFQRVKDLDGGLSASVTCFYAAEILVALEAMHAKGIVYRDLKLENVLLDGEGHCILTDFGLSAKIKDGQRIHSFSGTGSYMAPELLEDEDEGHTETVDVWAFGVFLFMLLLHEPPFFSQNHKELFERILHEDVKWTRYEKYLTSSSLSLLQGLLQKDPLKRLGCGPNGIRELREHSFFAEMDWKKLMARKIKPPFKPKHMDGEVVDGEIDVEGEFSEKPPAADLFQGFSFAADFGEISIEGDKKSKVKRKKDRILVRFEACIKAVEGLPINVDGENVTIKWNCKECKGESISVVSRERRAEWEEGSRATLFFQKHLDRDSKTEKLSDANVQFILCAGKRELAKTLVNLAPYAHHNIEETLIFELAKPSPTLVTSIAVKWKRFNGYILDPHSEDKSGEYRGIVTVSGKSYGLLADTNQPTTPANKSSSFLRGHRRVRSVILQPNTEHCPATSSDKSEQGVSTESKRSKFRRSISLQFMSKSPAEAQALIQKDQERLNCEEDDEDEKDANFAVHDVKFSDISVSGLSDFEGRRVHLVCILGEEKLKTRKTTVGEGKAVWKGCDIEAAVRLQRQRGASELFESETVLWSLKSRRKGTKKDTTKKDTKKDVTKKDMKKDSIIGKGSSTVDPLVMASSGYPASVSLKSSKGSYFLTFTASCTLHVFSRSRSNTDSRKPGKAKRSLTSSGSLRSRDLVASKSKSKSKDGASSFVSKDKETSRSGTEMLKKLGLKRKKSVDKIDLDAAKVKSPLETEGWDVYRYVKRLEKEAQDLRRSVKEHENALQAKEQQQKEADATNEELEVKLRTFKEGFDKMRVQLKGDQAAFLVKAQEEIIKHKAELASAQNQLKQKDVSISQTNNRLSEKTKFLENALQEKSAVESALAESKIELERLEKEMKVIKEEHASNVSLLKEQMQGTEDMANERINAQEAIIEQLRERNRNVEAECLLRDREWSTSKDVMEKEVRELTASVADYKEQLSRSTMGLQEQEVLDQQENTLLKARIRELEASLSVVQGQKEERQCLVDRWKVEVEQFREEVTILQSEKKDTIETYQRELDKLKMENEKLSSQLQQQLNHCTELKNENLDLLKRISVCDSQVEEALASAQKAGIEASGVLAEVSQLRESLPLLQGKLEEEKSKCAEAVSEKEKIHENLSKAMTRVSDLEEQNSSLAVNVSTLRNAEESLSQQVADATSRISNQEQRLQALSGLESELKTSLSEVATLQAQNDRLSSELSAVRADLRTSVADITEARQAVSEKSLAYEQLQAELESLTREVELRTRENEEIRLCNQTKIAELNSIITELNDRVELLSSERDTLHGTVSDSEQRLKELQEESKSLRSQLDTERKERAVDKEEFDVKVTAVSLQLSSTAAQAEASEKKAEEEVSTFRRECLELNEKVRTMEQEVSRQKHEQQKASETLQQQHGVAIVALQQQVASAEAAALRSSKQHEEVNTKLENLQSEHWELQREMNSTKAKARGQVMELEHKVQAMKSEHATTVQVLEAEVERLKPILAEKSHELETAQKSVTRLEIDVATARRTIEERDATLTKSDLHIKKMQERLEDADQRVSDVTCSLSELKDTYSALQSENAELMAQIRLFQREVDEKSKKVEETDAMLSVHMERSASVDESMAKLEAIRAKLDCEMKSHSLTAEEVSRLRRQLDDARLDAEKASTKADEKDALCNQLKDSSIAKEQALEEAKSALSQQKRLVTDLEKRLATAEAELSYSIKRNDGLSSELSAVRADLRTSVADITEARQAVSEKSLAYEQLQAELESLTREVELRTRENEEIRLCNQTKIAELNSIITELNDRVELLSSERDTLHGTVSDSEQRLKELQEESKSLRSQLDTERKERAVDKEEFDVKVTAVSLQLSSTAAQAEASEKKAEEEVSTFRRECLELNEKVRTMEQEVSRQKHEQQKASETLQQQHGVAIVALQQQVASAEAAALRSSKQHEEVNTKLENLQSEHWELQREMNSTKAKARGQVMELEHKVQAMKSEHATTVQVLEAEVERLKPILAEKSHELETAQKSVTRLEVDLSKLRDQLVQVESTTTAELTGAQAEIQILSQRTSSLELEKGELIDSLRSLRKEAVVTQENWEETRLQLKEQNTKNEELCRELSRFQDLEGAEPGDIVIMQNIFLAKRLWNEDNVVVSAQAVADWLHPYLLAGDFVLHERVCSAIQITMERASQDNTELAYWLAATIDLLKLLQARCDSFRGNVCDDGLTFFEEDEELEDLRPEVRLQFLIFKIAQCFVKNIYESLDFRVKAAIYIQNTAILELSMVYGEGPIRVEDVIDILDTVRKLLSECRIPAIVCGQLYEQIFYYMNSLLFNEMMSNERLCSSLVGFQTKLSIAALTDWISSLESDPESVQMTANAAQHLAYIVQAATCLVLLPNATDFDRQDFITTFPAINIRQIKHLVDHYQVDKRRFSEEIPSSVKQTVYDSYERSRSSSLPLFLPKKLNVNQIRLGQYS